MHSIIFNKRFFYKFFKTKNFFYFKTLRWLFNKTKKDDNIFHKSRKKFAKMHMVLRSKPWFKNPKEKLCFPKGKNVFKRTPRTKRAYCFITVSNTNVFVNIVSVKKKRILCSISSGFLGFKGRKCRSVPAVNQLIKRLVLKLSLLEIKGLYLIYRGVLFNKLLRNFSKQLNNFGFLIFSIFFNSLLPHNGCRPRKLKRK